MHFDSSEATNDTLSQYAHNNNYIMCPPATLTLLVILSAFPVKWYCDIINNHGVMVNAIGLATAKM